MTDQEESYGKKPDLEKRTAQFEEAISRFAKEIPVTPVTTPLIGQIVDASTSIGASYSQADAQSKKDFRQKIAVCRKESRETKHCLRMIVAAVESLAEPARVLGKEADELNRIFSRILVTCDKNIKAESGAK
jgi:four helix bundle protein